MMGRRAVLAGGVGLLSGCATTLDQPAETRNSDFAFDPEGPNGAVVGTIELVTRPGVMFAPTGNAIWLREPPDPQAIVVERRRREFDANLQGPSLMLRPTVQTTLADGDTSSVVVFAQLAPPVPIAPWRWVIRGGNNVWNIVVPPSSFTPRRGAVTYIGNFAMRMSGWYGAGSFFPRPQITVALRNRSERDLPLLRERLAWLRAQEIAVEMPNAPLWPRDLPA